MWAQRRLFVLMHLAVRAKSRGELAAQLKRRGIPLDVANEVLDRLERSKLINDL
jgi:SOS response regulatory protein OraA/RecX